MQPLSLTDTLPTDLDNALLVGRVWLDGTHPGPRIGYGARRQRHRYYRVWPHHG